MAGTFLVIPCFNEAGRLRPEPFHAALDADPGLHLLFVNDGSSDATAARIEEIRERAKDRIEVAHLGRNRGKGEAVRAGLQIALREQPAFVGYFDADLSTPLDTAMRFREVLARDPARVAVFGARVKLLGRRIERNEIRHYVGRIFASAVSWLLRTPIYDTQCGAKLFRPGPELESILAEPFRTRWIFDVEIVGRLARTLAATGRSLESALYEYPVETWVDTPGSKVGLGGYLRSLVDLVRIAGHLRRSTRPDRNPHTG